MRVPGAILLRKPRSFHSNQSMIESLSASVTYECVDGSGCVDMKVRKIRVVGPYHDSDQGIVHYRL